jgi:hypothetical protein
MRGFGTEMETTGIEPATSCKKDNAWTPPPSRERMREAVLSRDGAFDWLMDSGRCCPVALWLRASPHVH